MAHLDLSIFNTNDLTEQGVTLGVFEEY